VAEATYTVRVAWEPTPANAFVLDGSALNGPDQLTNVYTSSLDLLTFDLSTFDGTDVFAGTFDALYADVSDAVSSVSIRRGRDSNLTDFMAGEATITLVDLDGTYSPMNTASPLYPNVVPGRPVSIDATFGGTVYGQFRGFVRSIEYDPAPGARRTTFHAQDLFLHLSRAKPTITNTGTVTTGAAIGKVLDAVDWTDTAYRELGTGDTINAGFSNAATSTALELVGGFLDIERGEFYQGRGGTVVYRPRAARYSRTSSGTITDGAAYAVAASDLTNIRNRVSVVKTGAGTATHTDHASVTSYGASDATTIESTYLNDATQATALAQWMVTQTKDPSRPLRALRYVANKSDPAMVTALARDLGDRITVADVTLGGTADFYIEGIEHQVGKGGKLHEVSFALSSVPASAALTFGTSRVRDGGEYGSPTATGAPYDTVQTTSDVFAY